MLEPHALRREVQSAIFTLLRMLTPNETRLLAVILLLEELPEDQQRDVISYEDLLGLTGFSNQRDLDLAIGTLADLQLIPRPTIHPGVGFNINLSLKPYIASLSDQARRGP